MMHFCVELTIDNVQKQMSSLNIPESVGCDGISAHFLEEGFQNFKSSVIVQKG